jgi:hypothetical protein
VVGGAHAIRTPPTKIMILDKQIARRMFTLPKITPPEKAVTAPAIFKVITFYNTSPGRYFALNFTNDILKLTQSKK